MQLYLNIGLPSTGASGYCRFLNGPGRQRNVRLLLKSGRIPHALPAASAISSFYWSQRKVAEPEQFFKELSGARSKGKKKVVWNDNDFSLLPDLTGLNRYLDHFDSVKIVFAVRRQDQLIEEFFNRIQRKTGAFASIDQFIASMESIDYFNWFRKAEMWSDLVGRENLSILVYDPSIGFHDLLGSYLKAFEIVAPQARVIEPAADSAIHRDLVLVSHEAKKAGLYRRYRAMLQKAYELFTADHPTDQRYLMPPDRRQAIVDQYRDSNQQLAKTYFGADSIFTDDVEDRETWKPPEAESYVAFEIMKQMMQLQRSSSDSSSVPDRWRKAVSRLKGWFRSNSE